MSFLSDDEKDSLTVKRMIFHIVGKSYPQPSILDEVTPPEYTDFFIDRIKSALKGNLFKFREHSKTEASLRNINKAKKNFVTESERLVNDFQHWHTTKTSNGAFFLFELSTAVNATVFAIIKYDNEDVVRYFLKNNNNSQKPTLERFSENFVRKADAMQKIALIKLDNKKGGTLIVCDRSNRTHISGFFEGFLDVQRVNSEDDLSEKLVDALKEVFKLHRNLLPENIQKRGVNGIYDTLRQPGQEFDSENIEPLVIAIFGPLESASPVRKSLIKSLKNKGILEETFKINPQKITKPTRRKMMTEEGYEISYDDGMRPEIRDRKDGRKEIIVITNRITRDDIDTGKDSKRN